MTLPGLSSSTRTVAPVGSARSAGAATDAAGLAARAGLLERIGLTPEGTSLRSAIKGIDAALNHGLPLLVLSFHSPSLAPGNTPYVRSEADLDRFYDWLRGAYAHMAARKVTPTTLAKVLEAANMA